MAAAISCHYFTIFTIENTIVYIGVSYFMEPTFGNGVEFSAHLQNPPPLTNRVVRSAMFGDASYIIFNEININ